MVNGRESVYWRKNAAPEIPMANAIGIPIMRKTTNRITTRSTFTSFQPDYSDGAGQPQAAFTALISSMIALIFNAVVIDIRRLPMGTLRVTHV